VIILFQLALPGALLALEPAPDITDREVVEKLAKLEAGQQSLNHRISDLLTHMFFSIPWIYIIDISME